MSERPFMPMYVTDFVAATRHLSTLERGAHFSLVCHYWMGGKPLPDDDRQLAKIAGVARYVWLRMRAAIAELFEIAEGVWRDTKLDAQLGRVDEIRAERVKAGRASWRVRSSSALQQRATEAREETAQVIEIIRPDVNTCSNNRSTNQNQKEEDLTPVPTEQGVDPLPAHTRTREAASGCACEAAPAAAPATGLKSDISANSEDYAKRGNYVPPTATLEPEKPLTAEERAAIVERGLAIFRAPMRGEVKYA